MTKVYFAAAAAALLVGLPDIAAGASGKIVHGNASLGGGPGIVDRPGCCYVLDDSGNSVIVKYSDGNGVQGRVVKWPSCPAESSGADCAPKPLAARVVIYRRSGQQVATGDTREDGWFQIALPSGDYVVEARANGVLCAPVDVTVRSHDYVRLEVRCDTGVR